MATTQDQLNQQQDEFSAAFAEPEAEKPDEKTGSDGEPPAIAIVIDPISPEKRTEMAGEGQEEPGEADTLSPQDIQRQKSWEGRLKAMESQMKAKKSELDAREAELNRRQNSYTEGDEANADLHMKDNQREAAEETMAAVEAGKISSDDAIRVLSEDFGQDFADLMLTLIEAKASEVADRLTNDRFAPMKKTVDDLVGNIVDDRTRSHFEHISEKHPDFMELAQSPAFNAYVSSLPPEQRAAAEQVVTKGRARDVVKLLDQFKASQKSGESNPENVVDKHALDAAEGVRSRGLKLPEKPALSDDYESAWDQF